MAKWGAGEMDKRLNGLTSGSLAVLPDSSRFIRGVFVDAERGRVGAAPIAPEGIIAAPADRKASNDPASGTSGALSGADHRAVRAARLELSPGEGTSLRPMRVVVVGATGHIGSYLVPRLVSAGHEVIAISRGTRSPYFEHPAWRQVTEVQADREAEDESGVFGKRVAEAQPDAVVDLMCFNLASARQLVDALAPIDCYLLHCGTIWVHGTATTVPVTEDAVRRPFGEYGTQKAEIEELLLNEARRGTLPCTVLHPGHIVGPGWAPVNPAGNFNVNVFSKLAQGEEISLPHFGLETVHHVHADDVAQAFERALAHPSQRLGRSVPRRVRAGCHAPRLRRESGRLVRPDSPVVVRALGQLGGWMGRH